MLFHCLADDLSCSYDDWSAVGKHETIGSAGFGQNFADPPSIGQVDVASDYGRSNKF
jgi:hypothetical protein